MVTGISLVLGLEKGTKTRYVAIAMDLTMMSLSIILRLTVVDEYGERIPPDKKYLLYIFIVIMCNSTQFILTKLLLQKSKSLNLVSFAFWVYFFGSLGSFMLYVIECLWRGDFTFSVMPHMLFLIEEVIAVFFFSCLNEVANYLLLLYFIRKMLVTKASLYGIVGSIFIIFVFIFSDKPRSLLLWAEIVVFMSAYVIIFLTKRREKRLLNKGKSKLFKYYKDQQEDEMVDFTESIGRTLILEDHFSLEVVTEEGNLKQNVQTNPVKL
jgi:predicted neutral ceramidase superfamily lipid hydrolase